MGGASADGLQVMLTVGDHLLVIDGRDLWIPKASDLSVEKGGGLDQVGAGLGDMQATGLGLAALGAKGDHATPAAKVAQGREAQDVADEGDVDGGAVLADALKGLEMALRMQLPVKRPYD